MPHSQDARPIPLLPAQLAPAETPPPNAESDPVRPAVPEGILVRDSTFEGNDVGVRAEVGARPVEMVNVLLAGNGVGVESHGGRVVLDHARFDHNRDWDIRSTGGPWDVQWTGSAVEPSCVMVLGRESNGCTSGHIARTLPVAVAGLVFVLSEIVVYGLTRVGGLLGLYSRIDRSEILDHPVRARLVEMLAARPGRHLRALARRVGGYGKTSYHLHRLERAGLVRSERDGMYRRFYLVGEEAPEPEPTVRDRVLDFVRRHPGTHAREVARRLGESRQLVAYHLRVLERRGSVSRVEGERVHHLYPSRAES